MSQKIKKILTKNIGALQHGRTIEKKQGETRFNVGKVTRLIYVYNEQWKEGCRSDLSSCLLSIWRRYVYAGYQFREGTLGPLDFPSP